MQWKNISIRKRFIYINAIYHVKKKQFKNFRHFNIIMYYISLNSKALFSLKYFQHFQVKHDIYMKS